MSKKVKIFIDSSSTIDQEFIKKHDIGVIPLSLSDKNNKVYSDDTKDINPDILFAEIAKGNTFKTSCTQIGQMMVAIEDALDKYDIVYFLPISYGLSSQYNQLLMLQDDYKDKLFVIKSSSAAGANEFILKKLVGLVEENTKTPNEIVTHCNGLFEYTDTYFSCEDVSDLIHGGRITQGILKVIKILKLKPIILLDIKNQRAGMGTSYESNAKKMISLIKKDYDNKLDHSLIESIIVYYSGYEDAKKEYLVNTFSTAFNFPKDKILLRWVPTVVLAHTRKGAYGISILTKIPHKTREIKID